MFSEQVMTNAEAINLGTASRSNLSQNEKELLNKLKEYQISFNISNKNFGAVLYSCDEYIQQRGQSGAVGNNTANVTTSPGSNPCDLEAALASGSRPRPTRAMAPVENM